jgi:MFS family permease
MDISKRYLFRWLFFINFSVTLGFGIADAFFSVFAHDLGARGTMLGVAIGFYATSKIIFSPLMGLLSDRFGRKPLIVTSLIIFSLTSICYCLSTNITTIIALRTLQGIGCAMFRPVLISLVGENTAPLNRGKIVATFDMSFYGALSLGPVIGGIIMDHWSFNGIFTLLASLCMAALLASIFTIPTDRAKKSLTSREKQKRTRLKLKLSPGDNGTLPGLLVFIFGRACGIIAFVSFMPIFLTTKLGFNGTQIGMIMASSTLATTLSLRPMGKLADIFSRPTLITIGGIMVSGLYLLIPLAATFNQMLTLSLSIGFFSGLSQPASTALLVEEGKLYGTGFAIGSFNASLNLGLSVGSLVGALLLTSFGFTAIFYTVGIFGILAVTTFSLTTTNAIKIPKTIGSPQQHPN